jgi:restriction system-associated AAA family ATPase
MKLLHLKIASPFRGLPKEGIELHFRQNNYLPEDIHEPVCLVGLNGSGKSNVLEVICEIFYFLEIQNVADKKELRRINERYFALGFEIEYTISRLKWEYAFSQLGSKEGELGKENIVIRFVKPANGKFTCEAYYPAINQKFNIPENKISFVLPNRVVAYSSGQNELISNPFIKLDFHYFEEFQKRRSSINVAGDLDVNRMFFMDYESNQLVLLANYLFQENSMLYWKDRVAFNKKLRIEQLHSFSVKIQFRDHKKAFVELPSELYVGIEKLKKCATIWTDNENELGKNNPKSLKNRVVELHFFADVAVRQAFRNIFKTPTELFRLLYLLRLLNMYCYTNVARNAIKNAPKGTNLSDLLPKPSADETVFKIDNILFRKTNTTEPVAYKQLSDGEHQLLHVMGTLMLMQESDVLFILDEPETHFNPEWRAKMISLIMQNNGSNNNQQDYFITSHSPFIISDCKPNNVYIFNRQGNKITVETAAQKRLNTFGASVNALTEEVFNKNESIADYSLAALNKIKNRNFKNLADIQQAKEDARILGDSVEKTLLFRKLLILDDEFSKKKKTKIVKLKTKKKKSGVKKITQPVVAKSASGKKSSGKISKTKSAKPASSGSVIKKNSYKSKPGKAAKRK